MQHVVLAIHSSDVNDLQVNIDGVEFENEKVARNDGLTLENFATWFFPDLTGYFEGVVIHFTDFRY